MTRADMIAVAGRTLILGLVVEWGVVLVWLGIAGHWVYKQGRKRRWWDRTGQEIDAFNAATAPPAAEPARAARGVRVLQDRFRTWPQIWQGGTEAGPVVTLKARYASPASVREARLWAAVAAVALFAWMEGRATVWVPGDSSAWWGANIGPVFWCAVFAFAGYLVMRWLFPRLLWRIPGWQRPLLMRFEGGAITWGAGPHWLKAFQFWRSDPRGYVGPDETKRHAERLAPHRKAEAEAEANAERRARRRKPRTEFYRHASEVIMFVGPDNESWRPVAELADDPTAQWAGRLASAINEADAKARELLNEAAAKAPRPVLLVPVPGRARPDPEPGGLLE